MKKELGIYIHIPFCKKKCYYCDFVSYPDKLDLEERYIEAVIRELESYDLSKYNITTLYIGGGTPSYISSKLIAKLLNNIKEKLVLNETKWEDIEITIEVNPGTVNSEKLEEYKKSGVNRLSIGLQTTNDKMLEKIGRIHKYEDFLETYNLARKLGFKNINVDLIIGLPEEGINDIKEDLQKIINLNPDHISVYSLIVEEGTKIEKLLNEKKITLPDDEKERQMYWYVKNTLELIGYTHYEISNFAKENMESKHNMNCWDQKEYIGLGLAAYSYLDNIRYGNTSNLERYIENKDFTDEKELESNKIRIVDEVQSLDDRKKEYMMLGLRKIKGVKISKFKEKFGENPIYIFRNELEKLVKENLLIVDGDNIFLSNKGLDLANLVFEEFV